MVGEIGMKITDLMIGDWVCDNIGLHRKVISLTRHPDGNDYVMVSSGRRMLAEECTPISLSSQILRYNGFQILDGIHWSYENFQIPIHDNLRIPYFCGCEPPYFTHVHELQHALRMCGFDDLANSFKA